MLGARRASSVFLCPTLQFAHQPISFIATVHLTPKSTSQKKPTLWQTTGLIPGKRAPTELLFSQSLQRIFPNEEIQLKARKELNIKQGDSRGYLEVDAVIPRLKFYAEYQDPYHYTPAVYYANRPLAEIKATDAFKKHYFAEREESLLQLPCWWDGTDESLVATIKLIRPDLLQHLHPSCPPVSDTEPDNFLQYFVVPDVGTLMRPVFFNRKYLERGSSWLGNEKLDGVRCCWNFKTQKLYSRYGNELRFPVEFKQHMPDAFLDGEVWFGRGRFDEATKLRSDRVSTIDWPALRISVFDIAGMDNTLSYGERYKVLQTLVKDDHPFLLIPTEVQIENKEQQLDLERRIWKIGGEGLILTEKNSQYEPGNTCNVLKVKPALDKEALVVSSDKEFLTLELTDGTRFRTSIPEIQPPPRIGDVITINYRHTVFGTTLPSNPKILRVRGDLQWSDVVATDQVLPAERGRDFSMRWDKNLEDLRGYLTRFGKDNNFDPLVPSNWYRITLKDISAIPGATNLLKGFNGSYANALIAAFPDLEFDISKFSFVPKNHWKNLQNVINWFDDFAKDYGFDPNIPQNWYNVQRNDIVAKKGAHGILTYFKGSHILALRAAYPDIGINASKFATVPSGHWSDLKNVKKLFDGIALERGFDPILPQNWYTMRRRDFVAKKGAYSILTRYFKGNHIEALCKVYPNIGLDASKFKIPHKSRTPR